MPLKNYHQELLNKICFSIRLLQKVLRFSGFASLTFLLRYASVQSELKKVFPNVPVILEDMPDPHVARESVWIPFVLEKATERRNFYVKYLLGLTPSLLSLDAMKIP